MNERATFFSTEVGRDKGKTTVQFDRTIVNVISKQQWLVMRLLNKKSLQQLLMNTECIFLCNSRMMIRINCGKKIINDSVSQINTTTIKDANIKVYR